MIKLTGHEDSPLYVNPEEIKTVYSFEGKTRITDGTKGIYFVSESPEEVTRKILEYKLVMVRYGAACTEAVKHEDADAELAMDMNSDDINRLAGLEVPHG